MLQHLPSREGAIRGGVWQEDRIVEEEYSNNIACIIQEKYLLPYEQNWLTGGTDMLVVDEKYGSTGCGVYKRGVQNLKDFCLKINIPEGRPWILRIGVMGRSQRSGIILKII